MRMTIKTGLGPALAAAGLALAGCAPGLHLSEDFGRSVRGEVVAQVAEPDAKYVGIPEPGTSGYRVTSAQDRYNKGEVIQPASTSTSTVTVGGSSR
jgi:hypothetical protein